MDLMDGGSLFSRFARREEEGVAALSGTVGREWVHDYL